MAERIFALLAGGKASRLGGVEKLNLSFGKRTLMDTILAKFVATGYFDRFVVLCGTKDPSDFKTEFNVDFLKDVVEDGGPLIALYSLLMNLSDSDAVFLHGGDMPFTEPRLALWLYDRLLEGYEVSLFRTPRGLEPLFAWYRASVKQQVERAVESGERRVISFFSEARVFAAGVEEADEICRVEKTLFNINSEEDYRKALYLAEFACEKES